uniref:Uncharacterized protein n=1 Tax=Romanomermis culicivorax TaxID=13658 RepID=A0A915J0F1_ROMCU
MEAVFVTFISALRAAYEAYELFLTTTDLDAWASVSWEEASAEFKNWLKSQWGVEYPARQKPVRGFMKCSPWMFENPSLADDHLASHLWNILPPGARAEWGNADKRYAKQWIGLALPRF